jgi:UDP-glucuronate decarboxylase
MPTSLVTGGAGFLGSHLCDYLLENGHRVVCVDNLETGSLENVEHLRDDSFLFVYTDVVNGIWIDEPVDYVFHLASPASPIDYMRLPLQTLKVGSMGTHNALGLAKWKRARFLISSTSEVYGDPEQHPQAETYWGHVNPIGPRGVYDEAKRYAEALTMAYHNQQGVDTAIARIFNSILADEQVLFDDGRELRRERVSDLAVRLAGRILASPVPASVAQADRCLSPAVEYPLEGCSVPAFGRGGRIAAVVADALIAHPTEEQCFEIRTRYGRSIRTTGHHSVFVEGIDGEPEPRPVSELTVGDRIAIGRRLDVPERERRHINMLEVWQVSEGDPWELDVEAPGLGALAWDRRRDLFGLIVSENRNSGPNWRNGAWTKLIRMREIDRVPLAVLRYMGEPLPVTATVRARGAGRRASLPATIQITDDFLWLLGLWVAEGCSFERGKSACLSISGEDALLRRAESIIRRELGLHIIRTPPSPARSASIVVHSKLLLRLMDYLGFDGNRKRIPGWILGLPLSRLKWFIEGYREGDGVHSGI